MAKTTQILFHEIGYGYNLQPEKELEERDNEHIVYLINEGYSEGQLHNYDNETDEEYSGWWKINFK